MQVVTNSSGVVTALVSDHATALPDQLVSDVPLTLDDWQAAITAGQALGTPYEIALVGGKFQARTRAKNAVELDADDRTDIRTKAQNALNNWGSLTAAQKDTALQTVVRAVLKMLT